MSPYILLTIIALAVHCTSGQHRLNGNCTQDQVDQFKNSLPADCRSNFAKSGSSTTVTGIDFDVYCAENCVGATISFFRDKCNDSILANVLEIGCYKDTGKFGNHCLLVIMREDDEHKEFAAAGQFCLNGGTTCSANCSDTLKRIEGDLGCCYESYFNNSPLLDALAANGTIPQQTRQFFANLGNPDLWKRCNVPELAPCSKSETYN